MAWSTRQLAELTGTTLRTVRHYHEVGLLAEPERRANGYKQYGVAHLVRLLRIKRLTDLGLSLRRDRRDGRRRRAPRRRRCAGWTRSSPRRSNGCSGPRRARPILREAAPTDLPPEIAPAAARADLSDADRSYVVVLSRVLGPQGSRPTRT